MIECCYTTKENEKHVIWRKMNESGNYHVKQNKHNSERQIWHNFFHIKI